MVLPVERLLGRRVLARRPFIRIKEQTTEAARLDSPGTCESPRSRASMNRSNRAVLFHLSLLVAERNVKSAPLVPMHGILGARIIAAKSVILFSRCKSVKKAA